MTEGLATSDKAAEISSAMNSFEIAVRGGAEIKASRRGTGTRVFRILDPNSPKKDKDLGYGEHWCIEGAMSHALVDLQAGGLPFEELYGSIEKGTYGILPHYLTGSSEAKSPVDEWLGHGIFRIVNYQGRFRLKTHDLSRNRGEDWEAHNVYEGGTIMDVLIQAFGAKPLDQDRFDTK